MTGKDNQRFTESSKRDEDLRENPGIGQSKGAFAAGGDLDDAEGESTVEGDVDNDAGPQNQPSQRTERENA
jgi:hypothetical protein